MDGGKTKTFKKQFMQYASSFSLFQLMQYRLWRYIGYDEAMLMAGRILEHVAVTGHCTHRMTGLLTAVPPTSIVKEKCVSGKPREGGLGLCSKEQIQGFVWTSG